MMEIVEPLREELRELLDAIRSAGGGIVLEEFPGALGEDSTQPQDLAKRRGVEESEHGPAVCACEP